MNWGRKNRKKRAIRDKKKTYVAMVIIEPTVSCIF